MATFTIRFDLSGYDLTPGDRVNIVATPLIEAYPDPVTGRTYTSRASTSTDQSGSAEMTLVSLPGLQYEIQSWALGERVIDGNWPDGTVLRWEDLAEVVPSPIRPVDAAALRTEFLALIAAIPDGGGGGDPGNYDDLPDLTLLFNNGVI